MHTKTKIEWSEEEVQILKKLVLEKKYTYKQMLPFLPNRTRDSIKGKIGTLGFYNNYRQRTYIFDRQYFAIPTINNCYFAGVIAADGCLKIRKNTFIFTWALALQDVCLLERFLIEIKSNYVIRDAGSKLSKDGSRLMQYRKIDVNGCPEWVEDLNNNFNIVPNKIKILDGPKLNSVEQKLAFIAGYIDGDGSVFLSRDSFIINFTSSSFTVLRWIMCFIHSLDLPTPKAYLSPGINLGNGNCYSLAFSGCRAIYLFDILNKMPVQKLERKWSNPKILERITTIKAEHPDWFEESIESVMARNSINFEKSK